MSTASYRDPLVTSTSHGPVDQGVWIAPEEWQIEPDHHQASSLWDPAQMPRSAAEIQTIYDKVLLAVSRLDEPHHENAQSSIRAYETKVKQVQKEAMSHENSDGDSLTHDLTYISSVSDLWLDVLNKLKAGRKATLRRSAHVVTERDTKEE